MPATPLSKLGDLQPPSTSPGPAPQSTQKHHAPVSGAGGSLSEPPPSLREPPGRCRRGREASGLRAPPERRLHRHGAHRPPPQAPARPLLPRVQDSVPAGAAAGPSPLDSGPVRSSARGAPAMADVEPLPPQATSIVRQPCRDTPPTHTATRKGRSRLWRLRPFRVAVRVGKGRRGNGRGWGPASDVTASWQATASAEQRGWGRTERATIKDKIKGRGN